MGKILVDFSQTAISSVSVHADELRNEQSGDLIKHVILNQLLGLKKRFRGEMILCCDSSHYWRKEEFKHYKGHRKHSKDKSFLDWDFVYKILNEMKEELINNFPYKVLEVNGAEADDVIACLVKYFDENELVCVGLIAEPDNIVIVSSDLDYQQLQKYKNVSQWGNTQKKFIKTKNPKQFLIEHIVTGDTGDNVPNVCTGDWWAQERSDNIPTRAKAFKTARLMDFYDKGYDACLNEEEQRNFRRNEKLVDFDMIPSAIYNSIIKEYISIEVKGNKKKIFDYLQSKRMKLLLSSVSDF